jgi:hypothetical protein
MPKLDRLKAEAAALAELETCEQREEALILRAVDEGELPPGPMRRRLVFSALVAISSIVAPCNTSRAGRAATGRPVHLRGRP